MKGNEINIKHQVWLMRFSFLKNALAELVFVVLRIKTKQY